MDQRELIKHQLSRYPIEMGMPVEGSAPRPTMLIWVRHVLAARCEELTPRPSSGCGRLLHHAR